MKGFVPSIPKKTKRIKKKMWFLAITIYPFVFLCAEVGPIFEAHEQIHYEQQDRWWSWAGPFGLLIWYFLYLFVLPVGWNPFRWKWEYEAYRNGSKYEPERIVRMLTRKGGLYKLWWMG